MSQTAVSSITAVSPGSCQAARTYLFGGKSACLGTSVSHGIDPNILGQDGVFREGEIVVALNDGGVELGTTRFAFEGALEGRGGPGVGYGGKGRRGTSQESNGGQRELHVVVIGRSCVEE